MRTTTAFLAFLTTAFVLAPRARAQLPEDRFAFTTDRVFDEVRRTVTAAGFDEAMTVSAVEVDLSETFSPWTDAPPLRAETFVLRRADLQAGDTLLVHGAGGGVGVAAVSCGRAMGAKVIATARGETKLAAARERGAMHTLDSDDPDLVERIKALAPNRIDVVFDPVGGTMFEASLRTIAWEGRIVTIGFASGDIPQIPANHLLVKNAAVLGLYWGSYRKHDPQRVRAGFQRLFGWAACGELGSLAVEAIPFEEGSEALAALAGRRAVGKLVLAMDGAA